MINIGTKRLTTGFILALLFWPAGVHLLALDQEELDRACAGGQSAACVELGLAKKQVDYLESGCRQNYIPACFHLADFLMKEEETRRRALELYRQNCIRHDLLSCHRLNLHFQEARYQFCSHLDLNNCRDIMLETARAQGVDVQQLQNEHCQEALRSGCQSLAEWTGGSLAQQFWRLGCSLGNQKSCRALRN